MSVSLYIYVDGEMSDGYKQVDVIPNMGDIIILDKKPYEVTRRVFRYLRKATNGSMYRETMIELYTIASNVQFR